MIHHIYCRSCEHVAKGQIEQKAIFSKGRGTVLAMLEPRLTVITYPGRLARLLKDRHDWVDVVIVSEVYTCRSYARLLTSSASREVTVSLRADAPISLAAPGLAGTLGAGAHVHWETDCRDGDWKTAHYEDVGPSDAPRRTSLDSDAGRDEHVHWCYPLSKLVALHPAPGSPVSRV